MRLSSLWLLRIMEKGSGVQESWGRMEGTVAQSSEPPLHARLPPARRHVPVISHSLGQSRDCGGTGLPPQGQDPAVGPLLAPG